MKENRPFRFGVMAWQEISHKVNTLPLMDLLNEQIDLSKYGEGLQIVYFTFMTVPSGVQRGYTNSFRYHTAKKTLSA